ncbi:hypothetical protein SUGI_0599290 [Cryptomeria japonica]|nr:hypothetical protein SUGI_0599290 [Cryptomeria japonica]
MHLKSWSIKSGQERVRGFVVGTGSGTEIHTFEAMAYKIRAREIEIHTFEAMLCKIRVREGERICGSGTELCIYIGVLGYWTYGAYGIISLFERFRN